MTQNMKVNRKYLSKTPKAQDYIQLANSLFNLARQQNELIPHSLELETNICGQMIEVNCNGSPPLFMGASCSNDLSMDRMFAESFGLELHQWLKSRS